MKDFRKLQVWDKAHKLVLEVYQLSASFPRSELYGLTNQLRRSVASIPENIAEGYGKDTQAVLKHFQSIAMGSASELEYELLLAHDLGYLVDSNYEKLHNQTSEVKRMLTGLMSTIQARKNTEP